MHCARKHGIGSHQSRAEQKKGGGGGLQPDNKELHRITNATAGARTIFHKVVVVAAVCSPRWQEMCDLFGRFVCVVEAGSGVKLIVRVRVCCMINSIGYGTFFPFFRGANKRTRINYSCELL